MNQKIQAQDNKNTQDQNIDPRVGNPFYQGGSESEENIKITVEEEKLENVNDELPEVLPEGKIKNSEEEIVESPKNNKDNEVKQDEKGKKEETEDEEIEEVSIGEQLEEFLSRNLFLEPDLKQKILEADLTVQEEILPILSQMDEKQTDLFRKILEKNPHFFGDLENMAIRDALKKLVQREEQDHLAEIADAESELEDMLNSL